MSAPLTRRVFDFDVLACPRCGARLRVIATVQDPLVVQAILAHLARSGAPAPPGPAAAPLCPLLDRAPAPLPDGSEPAPDHDAHARLRRPRTGLPASSRMLKNPQAAQKGSDARRLPTAAREAYFLYVERAAEGANEADGPFSAAC